MSNLHLLCENGNIEELKKQVIKGEDINSLNESGMTPLMVAAKNGKKELVLFLLESGANIEIKDNDNKTAYLYAKESNHDELFVKILSYDYFIHEK